MVDKVLRLMRKQDHIRNICTSAHIDHGKTTFSDNLLAGAGMMSEELAGKACVLDFHKDEQLRGITIDAANVSMVQEFQGEEFLINLIDTPGHIDFGGDVTRAMRAIDGTIVLVCAIEGVMPQTETVLRQALKERVKPVLFINKVDRLVKELKLNHQQIQERFAKIISQLNKLISAIAEEEYKEKWLVNFADGSAAFGSARDKWALSASYINKTGVSFNEILEAYEKEDSEAVKEFSKKAPLHKVVLEIVAKKLPSPVEAQGYRIPKIWHGDLESEEGKAIRKCDPDGQFSFVITKIVVDPHAGEVCAGRIFSGSIKYGDSVYRSIGKNYSKVFQLSVYNGARREQIDSASAGNIIGIVGVKNAIPGETLSSSPIESFEQISYLFEPVITKAIEPKRASELPKLIHALKELQKEDPTLKIEINEETGENLIQGMGELHLEIAEGRIRDEKGVEVSSSEPIVVYRETISSSSHPVDGVSPNKHNVFLIKTAPVEKTLADAMRKREIVNKKLAKKDSGYFTILEKYGMNPTESKHVVEIFNGNILIDMTPGGINNKEALDLIEESFELAMMYGSSAKEPCTGIKVHIEDAKFDDVKREGSSQIISAVKDGIRSAVELSKPCLLEPVQTIQINSKVEYIGELTKIILNRRGHPIGVSHEADEVSLQARMPVAEMFGLGSDLRSATKGRVNYSIIDQTFERIPDELQKQAINNIRIRKGMMVIK